MWILEALYYLFLAGICCSVFLMILGYSLEIIRKRFLLKKYQTGWINKLQKFFAENPIVCKALGVWNGQGTNTFSSGKKYAGEFKNGLWNGQGTMTLPDGTKYVRAMEEWKRKWSRNANSI